MKDLNIEELEQIAEADAPRLGPSFLKEWTEPVLDLAYLEAGQRVLAIACGNGILTRVVAELVDHDTRDLISHVPETMLTEREDRLKGQV
jgi:ubiquinone/menaquinone biosynthesis C-methylase UbiE